MPWLLVVGCVPLTGLHAATCNTLGVIAALALEVTCGLPRSASGSAPNDDAVAMATAANAADPASHGAPPASAAPSTPTSPGSGSAGRRKAHLVPGAPTWPLGHKGGKATLKLQLAFRERWLHVAQVGPPLLPTACAARPAPTRRSLVQDGPSLCACHAPRASAAHSPAAHRPPPTAYPSGRPGAALRGVPRQQPALGAPLRAWRRDRLLPLAPASDGPEGTDGGAACGQV